MERTSQALSNNKFNLFTMVPLINQEGMKKTKIMNQEFRLQSRMALLTKFIPIMKKIPLRPLPQSYLTLNSQKFNKSTIKSIKNQSRMLYFKKTPGKVVCFLNLTCLNLKVVLLSQSHQKILMMTVAYFTSVYRMMVFTLLISILKRAI